MKSGILFNPFTFVSFLRFTTIINFGRNRTFALVIFARYTFIQTTSIITVYRLYVCQHCFCDFNK